MPGTNSVIPISDSGANHVFSSREKRMRDHLRKLWSKRHRYDLTTRHEMGAVLNARLGAPTKRQPRGRQVLEWLGEEIGCSPSDLSRMRWLAHLFPDRDNLQHGDVKIETWTRFKELLPSLKPHRGGGARKPTPGAPRDAVKAFAGSLRKLTARLRDRDDWSAGVESGLIRRGLQELVEAASSRLGMRARLVFPEDPIPDPVDERPERRRSESDEGGYVVSMTTAVPA